MRPAARLTESWKQAVVVENRPGGNTLIGAEAAARSAPDGYTLFVPIDSTLAMNQSLYAKLPYDPIMSFTPITLAIAMPMVLAVHPSVQAANVKELLGLAKPSAESGALKTLNEFWGTYEIAGVALVDMGMWHWMYDHPNATPAELNAATVQVAKDVWNRWYAPVFRTRDVTLLGVYAHMVDEFLYLPDYPIGHMIASQIEQQMEKVGNVGAEFERMATMGNVTPDLWMKNATGAPVGPEALLEAAERALDSVSS